MEFKDALKKYWFVGVVGILLIVFVSMYAVDAYKNREIKVTALQNDGKNVVYTIGDTNYYYADDFYDDLYETYGNSSGFTTFYRAVVDKAVETTDELTTYATNWASYILSSYEESEILSTLQNAGYSSIDDLSAYCLASLKYNKMMSDFYTENYDEYIKPIIDEENPRKIYHILIKVADVTASTDADGNDVYTPNPTKEESDKLNKVLEELKTTDFTQVAIDNSEDDSNAASGGYLKIVCESNASSYQYPFKVTAMSLKPGETSDVIATSYGYHIVYAEEVTLDDLLNDSEFSSIISQHNPNLDVKLIMENANKLGFEIVDENVTNYVNQYMEAE